MEGVFYGIYFYSAITIFGDSIDTGASTIFVKLLLIVYEIFFFSSTGNFEGSAGIINSGVLEIIKD